MDQEMLQATAEDLADVFKKVDAEARKGQREKPRRPISNVINFFAVSG